MELGVTRKVPDQSPPDNPAPLSARGRVTSPITPPSEEHSEDTSPRKKDTRRPTLTLSRFKRSKKHGTPLSLSVEEEELAQRAIRYNEVKAAERIAMWEKLLEQIPPYERESHLTYGDKVFYVPDHPCLIRLRPGTDNYYNIRAATKNKLVERVTSPVPVFNNECRWGVGGVVGE